MDAAAGALSPAAAPVPGYGSVALAPVLGEPVGHATLFGVTGLGAGYPGRVSIGTDSRGRSAVVRLSMSPRHRTADEDTTQTVDRTEPRQPVIDGRRRPENTVMDRPVTDKPAGQTADNDQTADSTADKTVDKTVVERPVPVEEAPRWAHVSAFATLGLIVGLVALAATLTGLLAPVGVAAGVVGGAISAGGLVGASRRGVTGHSIALLGLLASLAAIILGVMAIAGYLPWLDSRTDMVVRVREWLDAQLPWLRRW